ncbi:MAG: 2-C-methyl-D-erythritol 2,4-cyclodiphosphate synthase [Mariprofundaceae bacterium]
MNIRIGQGMDVHAFVVGRKLILGGVDIPYERGLAGHSDADVVTHAVCDALLGAAALGDIGHHFPDNDARFADANSMHLLADVVNKVCGDEGWHIMNIDITIVAQAPKIAPYIEAMRAEFASHLFISRGQINVKATTTEYLGFTGRKEGIAAFAVALISAQA